MTGWEINYDFCWGWMIGALTGFHVTFGVVIFVWWHGERQDKRLADAARRDAALAEIEVD